MIGCTCVFLCVLLKRDNSCDGLFASLDGETLQNGVYSKSKEFAPPGANSFL